jgi:hypothetical protein
MPLEPGDDPCRVIDDRGYSDVALEGLREALRQRLVTPDELWERARAGRVWSVMKPYLDATIARHD